MNGSRFCLPNHSWNWLNGFLSFLFTFPFNSIQLNEARLLNIEDFLFQPQFMNSFYNKKKISFWVFLLDLTMAWQMNNKYDILFRLLFALCEDVWMILYFAGCSSRSSGLANLSSDYRHLFNAPNSHSSKKKLIL